MISKTPKTILILFTLLTTFTELFSQIPKGKMINREVLLIRKFVGKYELKSAIAKPNKVEVKPDTVPKFPMLGSLLDSNDAKMKVTQGGSAFDNLSMMLVPYVKSTTSHQNLPINAYLADLNNVPFTYLYNEIFVTSDLTGGIYREFCRSHQLDYDERIKNEFELEPGLILKNNPALYTPGNHGVAQASIINAEWEEFEIEAASDFHFEMGHQTLVFDKRKIFIIKKIISIKPIDTLRNGEEKEYVQLIKSLESIETRF